MDRTELASRRRTHEVPAKPESGLAEWTSKIKAMQRQVDEDEEAETRRLEQEIAASRLARMRRSTGRGADFSNNDVADSLREPSSPSPVEDVRTPRDRHRSQEDAMRKLMGERGARSPPVPESYHAPSAAKSSQTAAPISLAAFMGGRATGPRLNKHAPQQDSYDASQFDQRQMSGSHPIFGKGGVAMPGMATRSRVPEPQRVNSVSPKTPTVRELVPPDRGDRDRRVSTPATAPVPIKSFVEKAEEQLVVAPQKTGGSNSTDWRSPRQRTMSTPTGVPPAKSSSGRKHEQKREKSLTRPISYSPVPIEQEPVRSTTPKGRPPPTANLEPPRILINGSTSPLPRSPTTLTPSYVATPPPRSPVISHTTGLAKPIQPTPRNVFQGPVISTTSTSSPVYLKTQSSKEPTPSLSRLQGRGFVQNMVRASSQVEPIPTGSPSSRAEPARKTTVMDRWQFGGAETPQIIAPKPVPMRKTRTNDSSPSVSSPPRPHSSVSSAVNSPPVRVIQPDYTGKSLRSVVSVPSLAQPQSSSRSNARPTSTRSDVGGDTPAAPKRNLGSSTTMISYVKPIKTGDNPPTSAPPSRPQSAAASRSRPASPEVDEHGMRMRSRAKSISNAAPVLVQSQERRSGGAVAAGNPLSHPTKDRARKPRKFKAPLQEAQKIKQPDDRASIQNGKSSDIPSASATGGSPPDNSRRVHFPLPVDTSPKHQPQHADRRPTTPVRHSRIPSTGNRATVMDVAQAFSERKLAGSPVQEPLPVQNTIPPGNQSPEPTRREPSRLVPTTATESNRPSLASVERRRSSYERYSNFILPPLTEEKTPAPSPAATLLRTSVPAPQAEHAVNSEQRPTLPPPKKPEATPAPALTPEYNSCSSALLSKTHVKLEHRDEPLPSIDLTALLSAKPSQYQPNPDVHTVSVDLLSITGNSATPLVQDTNVLYDTELIAVIHRSKAKSSGLVSTQVWVWRGSKSQVGEREERKLQELARRYNTTLVSIKQYAEPAEFVHILGSQLVTRQGVRAHWSSENTTMHLVRSQGGYIYIDELELNVKNLCSGFSYCISLLDTFYVWHGCGSIPKERHAALQYAHDLASAESSVIELIEGESDDDEMFWIILGEREYAMADYWRWKPSVGSSAVRAWVVNTSKGKEALSPVSSFSELSDVQDRVYILDCVWELFVLVGRNARDKRTDIRLGVVAANGMSARLAPVRPFSPTVHILILPSQIPIDLRLAFRGLNEAELNQGNVPDHMNLVHATEASEQLEKTLWERALLKDVTMLPVGLDPASIER